jgi:hypothetical protein
MPEQQNKSYRAAHSVAAAQEAQKTRSARKRARRREGMPLLLKILLVPFLLLIALLAGLITGYSILGHGPALDVFDVKTWKHMYDLVFG